MEHSSFVIRLKRGIFIVSPMVHHKPLSKELIANHLYGTAYILTLVSLQKYHFLPLVLLQINGIFEEVNEKISLLTDKNQSLSVFIFMYLNFSYLKTNC